MKVSSLLKTPYYPLFSLDSVLLVFLVLNCSYGTKELKITFELMFPNKAFVSLSKPAVNRKFHSMT